MAAIDTRTFRLTGDLRGHPLVWVDTSHAGALVTADVSDASLERSFGEGVGSRLRTWGHDENGVHWLGTRGGTPMHHDPAYTRYSHHVILRNDGWRLRGLNAASVPPLVVGVTYCLDTHSPHQVVVDDRLWRGRGKPRPGYKFMVAIDRDEPMDPADVWALCFPWLHHDPAPAVDGRMKNLRR